MENVEVHSESLLNQPVTPRKFGSYVHTDSLYTSIEQMKHYSLASSPD